MEDVAKRADVTRRTLYRYIRDETFVAEYRKRIEDELGAARGRVAAALVEGAATPGQGQGTMQKLYWQRLGELTDKHEVSGPGGEPIITEVVLRVVGPGDKE